MNNGSDTRRRSTRAGRRPAAVWLLLLLAAGVALSGATCSGFGVLFGPTEATEGAVSSLSTAIAVVQPIGATTAAPGAAVIIQWADIATTPGTVVRVTAQRQNDLAEDIGDPIQLVGDGTAGSGRDALADGDGDIFNWDITGVRVGDYVVTITIESPDGTTATSVSRDEDRGTSGVITVTTALPVPSLTFTAPGAGDVTVTTGNTFGITWTDNGTANADALLTLGLDPDDDHESGNEIILFREQALSDDDDTGQFTFSFLDEAGDTVPDGTYAVFAVLDDNANDPATVSATGRLVLNP